METKYGFSKMTATEFASYIANLKVARTVLFIQQHHTYIPSYAHFNGNNHFELQKSMKNTHVNVNGWADIGQHITIFPDGFVLTGRSFEKSPACITGNNANSFCIENLGNFDKNADEMTTKQKDAIIAVAAALCKKFGLAPNTNTIVYHHWFNLSTGVRNNGTGGNKSCPGTNFFGGNKVENCQQNFIPLVSAKLKSAATKSEPKILKYVSVTADSLNVRTGASVSNPKAKDRNPALFGAVLRIYEEKNNWYKISSTSEHWVSAAYTKTVKLALVTASVLNVRSGSGTSFPKIGSLPKGTEVFVYEQKNGWSKIGVDFKWVSDDYLSFG
ncbi:MAG: SH3 domain-containing protein [Flavobacteriaceae bacterium]|jgi:hypothetical protein|nr:SH3 domain-containing protein [Flavobacteriaceae bacterium]